MREILAEYEITTPMFIGGGDPQNVDLRPPSIKGVLRFWWRAMKWGDCLKETDSELEALKKLHRLEADLFGSAATPGVDSGQARFFIKIKSFESGGIENNWPAGNQTGSAYLGYGLTDDDKKAIRLGKFTLSLVLKKSVTLDQEEQLEKVLKLWGFLGGLGSRSRRGFGSVAIRSLNHENFEFKDEKDYFKSISSLMDSFQLAPEMPIFTAVNTDMTIVTLGQDTKDFQTLMNKLGASYKTGRQESGKGKDKIPFGLPLAKSDSSNRRSSPLFMHVHPIASRSIGIVSFIPAHFHPRYEKGKELSFYQPVKSYLDKMVRVWP
jgi:CRISPR-associated protein Cmr1